MLADGCPVVDGRATERVRADAHARLTDGLDVDNLVQLRDVEVQVVEGLDVRVMQQVRAGHAGNVLPFTRVEELVGARRDPAGRVGVGGPP